MTRRGRSCELDGYKFDSLPERARYVELKLLQQAGEITGLVVHPVYILAEGVATVGGKLRPVRFTPDFEYVEGGVTVIEDVKGYYVKRGNKRIPGTTQAFDLRWRLLRGMYPEREFRIVVME